MTNAFTQKRSVPWLKELEKNRKTSAIMQKQMQKPTARQIRELTLLNNKRETK